MSGRRSKKLRQIVRKVTEARLKKSMSVKVVLWFHVFCWVAKKLRLPVSWVKHLAKHGGVRAEVDIHQKSQ